MVDSVFSDREDSFTGSLNDVFTELVDGWVCFFCYDSSDKRYVIAAIKNVYSWPVSMWPRLSQTTKRKEIPLKGEGDGCWRH